MNKLVAYGISILMLSIFVAIMTSGHLLKKPFGESDQLEKFIMQLETAVKNEKWEDAQKTLERLDFAWKQIRKRVQFSVERDEVTELNRTFARLRGAIITEDKNSAILELYEAKEIWSDLAN